MGGNRNAAVFADVFSSTETTLHKIIHKDNEQHVGYVALLNYMETYHAACFSLNVLLSCRDIKLR